ncbi:hypothetical protein [Streptomyces spectabilis]|uniref:Uncharacterized protein n=1 Tax=Streptomyces spectabilis TaxID=68270 RepID=A0A516RF72_STRST|nr:hypothetical protein [Streptomyces spectabilis]QDQ14312.1 hypothetical protein FH965_30165 [Streptomyces spectabilis]
MTQFQDPDQERRMTGPWYENLEGNARLVAQVYDHGDGSCTIQVSDGRWLTLDGRSKLLAVEHYIDREAVDLNAAVRSLGFDVDSDAKEWNYTGAACWFDPSEWTGENTESYGIAVTERGPTE